MIFHLSRRIDESPMIFMILDSRNLWLRLDKSKKKCFLTLSKNPLLGNGYIFIELIEFQLIIHALGSIAR